MPGRARAADRASDHRTVVVCSAVGAVEQSGGAAAAVGGVEVLGFGEVEFHLASEGVDLVGSDRLAGHGFVDLAQLAQGESITE